MFNAKTRAACARACGASYHVAKEIWEHPEAPHPDRAGILLAAEFFIHEAQRPDAKPVDLNRCIFGALTALQTLIALEAQADLPPAPESVN